MARNVPRSSVSMASIVVSCVAPVWAQCPLVRILPSGVERDAALGVSVDIRGAVAVAGAATGDGVVFDSGTALVWERTPAGWVQTQTLFATDGHIGDAFGWDVATNGTSIVAGASDANSNGVFESGAVYAFERAGSAWVQSQRIEPPLVSVHGAFGWRVVLAGDTLFVSYRELGADLPGGTPIEVFGRFGGTWTQVGSIAASDTGVVHEFGRELASDGTTLVALGTVGFASYVYVFDRAGDAWTQTARLSVSTPASNEPPASCAVSGDVIAVGVPSEGVSHSGAVQLFERGVTGWVAGSRLTQAQPPTNARLGLAVALEGSMLVAGAPDSYPDGFVLPFRHTASGWVEGPRINSQSPLDITDFGWALALDHGALIVGAQRDGPPDISGAVYLPDAPTIDCDGNANPDACDIQLGAADDLDHDGVPDACRSAGILVCAGDGSGTPCPCQNSSPSSPHAGCLNSVGIGASLSATGLARVSADSLTLHARGMPAEALVVFCQATELANNGAGFAVGDGLSCLGGECVRLGTRQCAAGSTALGAEIEGDPSLSIRGLVPLVGGERHYQVWYRNAASFCTPATFNLSDAVSIPWSP